MEKEFVCKYCDKKFPSAQSLGGHIRIHSRRSSLDFNGSKNNNNNKKRLLEDQREITPPLKQQQQCRVCDKSFCSSKALENHMECHNNDVGEEKMIKRSKKQHNSNPDESFGIVSSASSDPEIVQGAKDLMFLRLGRKDYNFPEILDTKVSSDDDDDDDDDDDGDDDDDYIINGPKKSDSGISVGGSLRNTRVGSRFNSSVDELRNKEGRSKYEGDTNSKIHRSSGGMVKKASGANKNSEGHKCPVCYKVFGSGQALGGHKKAHTTTIANQEGRIKHKAADIHFDHNDLPAEEDSDDDE